MNEHDLFLAIGGVDDAYLTGEKQHRPKEGKRILWRMGLIAAMVSLLGITVSAAPVILGALRGGDIRFVEGEHPYISIYSTKGISPEGYQVLLDLDVDTNAPEVLEVPCLPVTLLENNPPSRCNWEKYGVVCWFRYYYPDGNVTSVRFEQYTIPETVDGLYPAMCRSIPGFTVGSRTFACGEKTIYEVTFTDPLGFRNGSRQLYWSDGSYIYYLLLEPEDIAAADYERIIESVQPMEDMAPYLTDHGVPEVFGELVPATVPAE